MTKTKKRLVLAAAVMIPFYGRAYAATYPAASCSQSDVSAAIKAELATPADGDVITIPACPSGVSWTGTAIIATFTTSVTIQGAGAESATDGGASTTGTDQTLLIDNIYDPATTNAMFKFTTTAGKSLRITGIAVDFPSSNPNTSYKAGWDIWGYTQALRIDHCHFYGYQGHWIRAIGWIYGVLDHNVADLHLANTNWLEFSNGAYWNNDSNGNGDQSWADYSYWGSNKFLFVEDSRFNNISAGQANVWTNDCDTGGRQVFRYNTFDQNVNIQTHPGKGNVRPCREGEYYKNTYLATSEQTGGVGITNGGALIWGNALQNEKAILDLDFERVGNGSSGGLFTPGWGMSNNNNASTLFYGTLNASGTTTVTWASGYAGYQFQTAWPTETSPNIVINGTTYVISSVPSATSLVTTTPVPSGTGLIYYLPSLWDGNTDQYGYPDLDMPGRGKSDLLTGSFFGTPPNRVDTVTGTVTWPNQSLDPIYVWNNTNVWPSDSGDSCVSPTAGQTALMLDNRDYYQQFGQYCEPGSFNGTAGVGQGVYSALPSTCTAGPGGNTPGVGYWATDKNTLYACTATNTWTAYYTPYTYPHPLTGPDPPTNLTVSVN